MSLFSNNALIGASAAGDYTIQKSLRFNSGDSADLVYAPSSTGSRRTFTWSVWVKRTTLGASQNIFTKTDNWYNRETETNEFYTINKIQS